jgi:hypothetical protein
MTTMKINSEFRPVFFPLNGQTLYFCPDGTIKLKTTLNEYIMPIDFSEVTEEMINSLAPEDHGFVTLFLATMEH